MHVHVIIVHLRLLLLLRKGCVLRGRWIHAHPHTHPGRKCVLWQWLLLWLLLLVLLLLLLLHGASHGGGVLRWVLLLLLVVVVLFLLLLHGLLILPMRRLLLLLLRQAGMRVWRPVRSGRTL